MQDTDSDTYMAILEEGMVNGIRNSIFAVGEELLGPCDEVTRSRLSQVVDLDPVMLRRAAKAVSWQEIIDTP